MSDNRDFDEELNIEYIEEAITENIPDDTETVTKEAGPSWDEMVEVDDISEVTSDTIELPELELKDEYFNESDEPGESEDDHLGQTDSLDETDSSDEDLDGLWDDVEENGYFDDDLDDLLEVIDNLSDMRYRIEQLNDMSIDLKTCEPGRLHKTIKITIIDNRHEYDFMTTGQDLVSESVLKMISAERERVTTALRSENRKIR